MERTSRIPGFYKLPVEERVKIVKEFAGLTDEEASLLMKAGNLDISVADRMIENVIGTWPLPLGIATNFLINGRDYLIPMAIEEPSVVAAASNAAKMAREGGGFFTSSTDPIMISQIQLVKVKDAEEARNAILAEKQRILEIANERDPVLVRLGGGARDLEVRIIDTIMGKMVITHLIVDVRDAMGANVVNTMAEAVAPFIERITGGRVYLRILSNLADRRLASARAVWKKEEIGGDEVVEGILYAYAFAEADPYRAATHNKGIMNGIIAVARATGQDTRAIEAGAHSYAARNGRYTSLSRFWRNEDGDLEGFLEMPLAVGIVGGVANVHPIARIALKILGVKSARELSEVMVAVGLAQNFAALRALATEGIQAGHMKLHARNIAMAAGATPDIVDEVVERMLREKTIRIDVAKRIIEEIRSKK
ncbi:hydroxymethylglutaryl-CoA reductase, degradative [Candidatus Methanodesulfokora washburnensis]|jgi:hydroxymethylglutaryl-CoA reductase|uniref:3-hydroxy-3-methylglutaryl coenzyme A reductase n=1 Tax=Candidatus Methanodesulfokora washburnensis TaxID=2478471 RepID=A0A3R9RT12_9CREN|nr:hydroxymethylglutaryl-CoA reductase, degradative [Candidatus Methanodesulfokores washburnensis]RSN78034.1 hydroxymethylglutaryl-CoA reductase, degradative [Candidatus Methanodesulfokores washburnensis]